MKGAVVTGKGRVNFSVFSENASGCTLVLLDEGGVIAAEIDFPENCRFGEWFSMEVRGLGPLSGIRYGYRIDGGQLLVDPYARLIHSGRLCAIPADNPFPKGDTSPSVPDEKLIIYELHVRNFTRHPSSGCAFPGTFRALKEKIPYLTSLGINCVELMPVFEFDSSRNAWGYDSINFFAPKESYAAEGGSGDAREEFRDLVKHLHSSGIEVILDVVFNHSPEYDETGPTISWRGLDNSSYYFLDRDGRYIDFTGCRNTLSCNSPAMQEIIVDSLRHWVEYYHVDGFRFDLASVLTRGVDGVPADIPPVIEKISSDPVLSRARLIAEPWDAAGLYQLGAFRKWGRWKEWNDRYRDAVRRFSKSDEGLLKEVRLRMEGSPDIFGEHRSINFITAHDGFTMADLVSYNHKHNEANGEGGLDGSDANFSWNCGCEGPTNNVEITGLRKRRIKNLITMLMLSRGIPMILYGDEIGRTQRGNNNPWCIDDESVWMNWEDVERNAEILRYFKLIIAFRKARPELAGASSPISWRSENPAQEWDDHNGLSTAMVVETAGGATIFAAMNMHWEPHSFILPEGRRWRIAADTSKPSPSDIFEAGKEPPYTGSGAIEVEQRSIVILVGN